LKKKLDISDMSMNDQHRILVLFGSGVVFGQERGNIEALAALMEQGCKILCLVRPGRFSSRITKMLDERGLPWRKIPYIEQRIPGRLLWFLFRNPAAFFVANLLFIRIFRQYRPTHIYAYNQLYVLNFLIALMLVRTPIVYRAGDKPTIHNWIWRTTWRFVVRRTRYFVANSEFVSRSLQINGAARECITVIYNKPPARVSDYANSGVPLLCRRARAIVFVGQISEHKGVHMLVDAFRELADAYPDARLLIAGPISDWSGDADARRLKSRTNNDPVIGTRVEFLGEVEDVPSLLTRAEIHVAPSLFEDPSPNVVMEAKLAGRTSVVFPRGGLPELVDHGVNGYVCEEASVASLVIALRTYLKDPTIALRQGKAARESLTKMGIPEFSERWLDVCSAASR
jgi:glycosyltransferase involved in cell wall biosynthesis